MFTRMLTPRFNSACMQVSACYVNFHPSEIVRFNQMCLCSNNNTSFPITDSKSEQYRKKTAVVPKITLLSSNNLNVTTLEDAQKLAKRRDLKLVKIVDIDTKTQRPVYKLMTGAEYHEEDLKQRERKKAEKQNSFKGEKVLLIGQNISEHDLQTHCSKILKWLGKKFEVKIVISGNIENISKAESIYLYLEEKIKDHGRIVQKRQKGSDIKFQILPSKESKTNNDDDKKKDATSI